LVFPIPVVLIGEGLSNRRRIVASRESQTPAEIRILVAERRRKNLKRLAAPRRKYLLHLLTPPQTFPEVQFLIRLLAWLQTEYRKPAWCCRRRSYWWVIDGRPGNFVSDQAKARQRRFDAKVARKLAVRESRVLDPEKILALIRRYKAGDVAAGNQIILAHRYVVEQAEKKFKRNANDTEDRIQQGIFGLRKALKTYAPESGVPFEAYARQPVRWAISDYIKRQKKHYLPSLDAPVPRRSDSGTYTDSNDDNGRPSTFQGFVTEAHPLGALEDWQMQEIPTGDPRQQYIIQARLAGKTNREIGAELGISAERVRQLIARLSKKN
jgi:RNA polymerase sigma factor (sigma-70 family)